MLALLLGCISMAFKDLVGTFLTVAMAHGRASWAAVLDGLYDLATIVVTIVGAGAVVLHGWTPHTGLLLAVMVATSVAGTYVWTKLAAKWLPTK